MEQRLRDLLCCPQTHRPLRALARAQLAAINAAIADGTAQRVNGTPLARAIDDGLIRDDGLVVYPIEDGIPVLLADEAIGTQQFRDFPA